MNLLKVLAAVVVLMLVASIQAQDTVQIQETVEMPLYSFTKFEGKTVIAIGHAQHQAVSSMVTIVNVLKKAKSDQKIDAPTYDAKVAALIEHAKSLGVNIN